MWQLSSHSSPSFTSIRILEIGLAGAHGFDLGTGQDDSGLDFSSKK